MTGPEKKGGSDWCIPKSQSVCHLCYFSKSSVQPTVPGKTWEVSDARKLSTLSRSCSTAMLTEVAQSQSASFHLLSPEKTLNSPRGGIVAVEPNAALGQAHLSITSFLVPLLVAKITHPRLQASLGLVIKIISPGGKTRATCCWDMGTVGFFPSWLSLQSFGSPWKFLFSFGSP